MSGRGIRPRRKQNNIGCELKAGKKVKTYSFIFFTFNHDFDIGQSKDNRMFVSKLKILYVMDKIKHTNRYKNVCRGITHTNYF